MIAAGAALEVAPGTVMVTVTTGDGPREVEEAYPACSCG
jgi:hypothetical protein